MPRITEELVRKRAEHNELQIGSLEELSLHQEDIEKLENLQYWCKDLKILLLQSNLIPKIENLKKLKKLEYINLSLNNIEKIENLHRCESLEKVDLTINFIGDLISVESLKNNINLRTLYLTGNPCTNYKGYRKFVIATLPQLENLDGTPVLRSERITALHELSFIKIEIYNQQKAYFLERRKQRLKNLKTLKNEEEVKKMTDEDLQKYWNSPSGHSPETRLEIAMVSRKSKEVKVKPDPLKPPKRVYNQFTSTGQPRNVNQAKIDFALTEDDEINSYVLNLKVYKFLDTNLLEVDIQPTYVTVRIKGKLFQLVLNEEIKPDASTAKRSKTTGYLVITMPKVKEILKPRIAKPTTPKTAETEGKQLDNKSNYLEFDENRNTNMDFSKIIKMKSDEKKNEEFEDDPEVPPLVD